MSRPPQQETPETPDPLHWTPAFRRWLWQRYFDKFFLSVWKTPSNAWRHFLTSTMCDTTAKMPDGSTVKIPRTATVDECYNSAIALFQKTEPPKPSN